MSCQLHRRRPRRSGFRSWAGTVRLASLRGIPCRLHAELPGGGRGDCVVRPLHAQAQEGRQRGLQRTGCSTAPKRRRQAIGACIPPTPSPEKPRTCVAVALYTLFNAREAFEVS